MSKRQVDYIEECEIEGQAKPLNTEQIRDILEQIGKNICCIKLPNRHGTGFFCNIPFSDFDKINTKNKMPVLITNYHVLSQDYLDENEIIELTLNENKIKKEIKLTNKRKNYTNEGFDVTIIELNPEEDSIEKNSFFDVDPIIYFDNPHEECQDKEVYIIGNINKISNGILKRIYKNGIDMEYYFSTEPGMSGSPIINLNTYKVIGVHKGANKNKTSNYGTFLREPIKQFYLKNKNSNTTEPKLKSIEGGINPPIKMMKMGRNGFSEKMAALQARMAGSGGDGSKTSSYTPVSIENKEKKELKEDKEGLKLKEKKRFLEKQIFKGEESTKENINEKKFYSNKSNNAPFSKDIILSEFTEDKKISYIKEFGNKIKICVLGKLCSKKSTIIYRFINYNAPEEHDPTIEDRYKASINIEGIDFEIEILDTNGEEDYQNMMDMWISFGEGFLLVFDITNRESFEVLKGRYHRIVKGKHGEQVPIILVGNKKELEKQRKVSFEEANKLADSLGIEYIEISDKIKLNCKECFEKLSKAILISKLEKLKKKKKNSLKECIIY